MFEWESSLHLELSNLSATVSVRWGNQLVIEMGMGLIRSKVFRNLFGPQQPYLFHFNDNCSLHRLISTNETLRYNIEILNLIRCTLGQGQINNILF